MNQTEFWQGFDIALEIVEVILYENENISVEVYKEIMQEIEEEAQSMKEDD